MTTDNTACCSWRGASGHSDHKARIPTPTGRILWPIDYPPRRICLLLMCASHTLVGQGPPPMAAVYGGFSGVQQQCDRQAPGLLGHFRV